MIRRRPRGIVVFYGPSDDGGHLDLFGCETLIPEIEAQHQRMAGTEMGSFLMADLATNQDKYCRNYG